VARWLEVNKNRNLLINMHLHRIPSLSAFVLSAVLALGFLVQAKAADNTDVAGTWTWTVKGRQGGADRKITAKFKVDGDKVTGKISSPGRDGQDTETEIKDGQIKGDQLSFSVTRERNGNSMTMKYTGKVTGDTIKGNTESERNGEAMKRDWEAKRGDTTTKETK
jgi:hypothetical protein